MIPRMISTNRMSTLASSDNMKPLQRCQDVLKVYAWSEMPQLSPGIIRGIREAMVRQIHFWKDLWYRIFFSSPE